MDKKMTIEDAWWLGARERDLNVTTNLDEYGEDVADAYEYGRRLAPLPESFHA